MYIIRFGAKTRRYRSKMDNLVTRMTGQQMTWDTIASYDITSTLLEFRSSHAVPWRMMPDSGRSNSRRVSRCPICLPPERRPCESSNQSAITYEPAFAVRRGGRVHGDLLTQTSTEASIPRCQQATETVDEDNGSHSSQDECRSTRILV